MSVSKEPKTLQNLLASEQATLQAAQARFDKVKTLLDALPEGTPVPQTIHDFGYCAQASIQFSEPGLVQRLLQLYPPMRLVDLNDGCSQTQKPHKYLRDREVDAPWADIYPVVVKNDTGPMKSPSQARWWTELAGMDVQMSAPIAGTMDLVSNPEAFVPQSHSYATGSCSFFLRRVLQLDGAEPAFALWERQWAEFADREALRANQRQFVNALRVMVDKSPGIVIGQADLPEPHYTRPGTAMAIPPDREMVEYLAEMQERERNRKAHAWDRIGDFRAVFSADEIERLLAFANERSADCLAAIVQEREQHLLVEAWLREFIASHGPVVRHESNLAPAVEQLCRRATGLYVRVGLSERGMRSVAVSYRLGRDQANRVRPHLHLTLPCSENSPPLRARDLPVEYM